MGNEPQQATYAWRVASLMDSCSVAIPLALQLLFHDQQAGKPWCSTLNLLPETLVPLHCLDAAMHRCTCTCTCESGHLPAMPGAAAHTELLFWPSKCCRDTESMWPRWPARGFIRRGCCCCCCCCIRIRADRPASMLVLWMLCPTGAGSGSCVLGWASWLGCM